MATVDFCPQDSKIAALWACFLNMKKRKAKPTYRSAAYVEKNRRSAIEMERLLKCFIKNYQDRKNPSVHLAVGKFAGVVGVICNFLLGGCKLAVGLIGGSVSITADALNNLSDAISSMITLLGFRMAQRPADAEHPYGHARFEYISGLMVAVLILVMGVEMLKSSISKIITPSEVELGTATLVILALSVCVKCWMYAFNRYLGRHIQSAALCATAADSRNDAIATAVVLLGCVIYRLTGANIDGYLGLAVAAFILYSGVGILKETVTDLLGKPADRELVAQINDIILSHEKILGIHDLLLHDYGPGKCYASVHVELSADVDALTGHEIIDDIEKDVKRHIGVQLVIHCDPIVLS